MAVRWKDINAAGKACIHRSIHVISASGASHLHLSKVFFSIFFIFYFFFSLDFPQDFCSKSITIGIRTAFFWTKSFFLPPIFGGLFIFRRMLHIHLNVRWWMVTCGWECSHSQIHGASHQLRAKPSILLKLFFLYYHAKIFHLINNTISMG